MTEMGNMQLIAEYVRPDHPWNDPDGDGHNCLDCGPDGFWKCDPGIHPLEQIKNPRDLLTDEQNAKLNEDLAEMSRQRRRAEASSRDLPLC